MDRLGLRGLRGAHRGPEVTADTEEAPELALRRGQCPGQGQELSLRTPLTRSQEACPGLDTRGRARAIPELGSGVRAGPRPWHCQATSAQGSWMGPPGPGPLQPRPSPHPASLRHRDRNQGPGRGHRAGGSESWGDSESWGVRELGGGAGRTVICMRGPAPSQGMKRGRSGVGTLCSALGPQTAGRHHVHHGLVPSAPHPGCSLHR